MAKMQKDEGPIRFDSSALEKYRAYLKVMAQVRITRDLRRHVDPSDVVQQTLMDAYRCRTQFRGKTEKERAACLRQILNLPPAAVGGRLRRGIERLSQIVQGQAKGDETEDEPFPNGQGLASG